MVFWKVAFISEGVNMKVNYSILQPKNRAAANSPVRTKTHENGCKKLDFGLWRISFT